jgi:hypothetical protein
VAESDAYHEFRALGSIKGGWTFLFLTITLASMGHLMGGSWPQGTLSLGTVSRAYFSRNQILQIRLLDVVHTMKLKFVTAVSDHIVEAK